MSPRLRSIFTCMTRLSERDSTYQYLFGPVASRRLGTSLGLDLVPAKVCTLNCRYCEAGQTTTLTVERKEYVPADAVLEELSRWLEANDTPDYITLSGAGEPTLNSRAGDVIAGVKDMTDARVAVLTNGTLLHLPEVRAALLRADVVVPSLDASNDDEMRRVNNPHPLVNHAQLVEGLRAFRCEFPGEIWLEVLLVAGVTDSDETVSRLAGLAESIAPDRIQLNTVVRPAAFEGTEAVPHARLLEIADRFTPRAEVIAPGVSARSTTAVAITRSDIVALLRRRPCPLDEIVRGLGVSAEDAQVHLRGLQDAGLVHTRIQDGVEHYSA